LQDAVGVLQRIWSYVTQQFTFGRITVSVSSVMIGLVVITATIVIARALSNLIERRMAARRHIDPGLRYTIARLVKYVLMTVGVLLALKQASLSTSLQLLSSSPRYQLASDLVCSISQPTSRRASYFFLNGQSELAIASRLAKTKEMFRASTCAQPSSAPTTGSRSSCPTQSSLLKEL